MLMVATALAALKVKGRALWEKYDNGDNLLFTEADLLALPTKSPLFYAFLKQDDPVVRSLADALIEAARKPLDQTPLLEDVLPGLRSTPTRTPAQVAKKTASVTVGATVPSSKHERDFGEATKGPTAVRWPKQTPQQDTGLRVRIWMPAAVALAGVLVLFAIVTGAVFFATRGQTSTPTDRPEIAKNRSTDTHTRNEQRSAKCSSAEPPVSIPIRPPR